MHIQNTEATQTNTNPSSGRWSLIKSVAGQYDENALMDLILEICSIIARTNKNLVLEYYVDATKHKIAKTTQVYNDSFKSMLNTLTRQQFQTLLLVCKDLIKNNQRPSGEAISTEDVRAMAAKITSSIEALQAESQEIGVLTDSGSDAISSLNTSVTSHHPSFQKLNATTEITAPMIGALFVVQAFYDAFLNYASLRNAFDEYRKTLAATKPASIEKALAENYLPDLQVAQIKNDALNKLCGNVFNHTLYTGSVYSVLFGTMLMMVAPYAYLYAGAGVLVSVAAARNNSKRMYSKIQEFIDNPEFNAITVELIKQDISDTSPAHIRSCLHSSVVTASRTAPVTIRALALMKAMFLPIAPLVTGISSAAYALLSWGTARKYLKLVKENPQAALLGSLNTDPEVVEFVKFRGSNLMRTYLFKVRGIDLLEKDLIANDIDIKSESRFTNYMRDVLAPVGLMYDNKTNDILDALYDGTNPDALRLVDDLRNNARYYQFKKELDDFFANKHQGIDVGFNLHDLITKYVNRQSDEESRMLGKYLTNIMLRLHLMNTIDANINFTTWMTGLTLGVSWSLLIMGIGLNAFNNLAPEFAAIAGSLLAVAIVSTYLVNKYARADIKKALANVSDRDLEEILKKSNMPHFDLVQQQRYDSNILLMPEQNAYSLTRQLKLEAPSLFKGKTDLRAQAAIFCKQLNAAKFMQEKMPEAKFALIENNQKYTYDLVFKQEEQENAVEHKILTLYSRDTIRHANDFGKIEWQVYLAFHVAASLEFCVINLNNPEYAGEENSAKHAEDLAKSLIAAIVSEFIAPDYLRCNLKFICEDNQTLQTVQKVLVLPQFTVDEVVYTPEALEKVRAHFGLMLIDGKLYDIQTLQGGMSHPFLNEQYMQKLISLAPNDYASETEEEEKAEDNLPTVSMQIYTAIKDALKSGLTVVTGDSDDEDESLLYIQTPDLQSKDPTFDKQFIACIEVRKKEFKQELNNLIEINNQLTQKSKDDDRNATSETPFLDVEEQALEAQVGHLEAKFIELKNDIKMISEYYELLNKAMPTEEEQTNLVKKGFEYYQKRENALNAQRTIQNKYTETARNWLVNFRSGSPRDPKELERAALAKFRDTFKKYRIGNN